jgi:outer membrane protein assembly factor BamB
MPINAAKKLGACLEARRRRCTARRAPSFRGVVGIASTVAMLLVLATTPASVTTAQAAPRRPLASSHLLVSPTVVNETLYPGDPPTSTYSVTLANTGVGTSTWAIASSSVPSWLGVAPTSGTLASGSSISLTLTFTAPSSTPQTLSTNLSITDPNADNGPVSLPVNLSVGYYSRTWYFAEGFTGTGFTEYLTLANPNPDPASVTVQYLLQGALPLTLTYSVLSNARFTINVNKVVGPGFSVALAITSDLPIVAERPMYFTYTGIPGVQIPGGTDTLGATSLGVTFAFAYLDTTANHRTYLTVLNQNSVAIQALVKYYPSGGGTALNRVHTIPARSRGTITVNNEGLGAGTFSGVVSLSATAPNTQTPALGLVERPMYLKDNVTGYTGAADVIGIQAGSSSWYFAEGFTSSTFSERYILANPLSTVASRATITFFRPNGSSVQQVVPLEPGQQVVVNANSLLGNGNVSNSASVSADQPILAERYMGFTYTGPLGPTSTSGQPIPGATDVLGAQQTSDLYDFAEGFTGNDFGEYLTVENPNASAITLSVTFLPANGSSPTVKTYSVGPTSRFTLLTNKVIPGQSFSMLVQANGGNVVAERPMYFAYGGSQTGGTDVVGYAPHVAQYYNQGYCLPYCNYVTTDSYNAGGLDQTTGLLEWTYQSDLVAFDAPYVDPYSGDTFTSFESTSYYSNLQQTVLVASQQTYELWSYYPPQGYLFDTFGGSGGYVPPILGSGNGRVFFGITYEQPAPISTLYALDTYSGATDWTFSLASYGMDTRPVDLNGALYVTDSSGELYSLNDSTGALNWKVPLAPYPYGATAIAGSQNGLIYVRAYGVTASQDAIEALRVADGSVAWSTLVPTGGSSLVLANSMLYTDDGNTNIYALDAATGTQLWTSAVGVISAVNGGILVAFNYYTYSLVALNSSNGATQWQFSLGASTFVCTQLVLTASTDTNGPSVYFGACSSGPVTIYALNAATGAEQWQYATAETPQLGPYSYLPSLGVSYSGVYYADDTASAVYVYGIGITNGTLMWKTELDVPANAYSPQGGMTVGSPIGVTSYTHSRTSSRNHRAQVVRR